MRYTLLLASLCTALVCHAQQTKTDLSQSHADIQKQLEEHISKFEIDKYFVGGAIALVAPSGELQTATFGYANADEKTPYTDQTIQPIASVSKTAIGLALLKAQEQGLLKLDDPINQHLPFEVRNPHFPKEEITIRQLTCHTSSITDNDNYDGKSYILRESVDRKDTAQFDMPDYFSEPNERVSLGEFLENYLSEKGAWYQKDAFIKHKPGERFDYSNVGATLCAYIIECASKKPFSEYATEHVFLPLGMKSSGWQHQDIDFGKHTTFYSDAAHIIPSYSLITYPDGGLLTTIHDLGLYMQELMKAQQGNGTLLSKESYAAYFAPQLVAAQFEEERDAEKPYNDEYNMGIFMGISANGFIGHTGGDPGVSSFFFFDPKTQVGQIIYVNTDINSEEGWYSYYDTFNQMRTLVLEEKK